MKQFLIKIGIFFVLVVAADFLLGAAFTSLVARATEGDNGRNNYICDKTNEDILIFGSSRAIHHYNPQILSDSLGMTCYNCGQDGNGAILNYGRYHLINQRYHPQLVIYDVSAGFDLLAGDDNHKYLGWLKAYYDRDGMDEIFNDVDPLEGIKMNSWLYRYNSKFTQIVFDNIHPMQSSGINGFRPIVGEMDTLKISRNSLEDTIVSYDSLKIAYLMKFINESKDTKLIFTISPSWNGMDEKPFDTIKFLCKERNIPLINYSNHSKYVHHNEFFADGAHLNQRGAEEYSKDIVTELRKYMRFKDNSSYNRRKDR